MLDQTKLISLAAMMSAPAAATADTGALAVHAAGIYSEVHALPTVSVTSNEDVAAAMQALADAGIISFGGLLLLRDLYTDDLAAGAVDGTSATPGPGERTVVDTGSNLALSDGAAVFSGGVTYGDPGLWYESLERAAGVTATFSVLPGVGAQFYWGFHNAQSSRPNRSAFRSLSDKLQVYDTGVTTAVLNDHSELASYTIILRESGAFFLVDGDLLFVTDGDTSATLYPTVSGSGTSVADVESVDVVQPLQAPTPVLSDTGTDVPAIADSGANGLDATAVDVGLGGSTGVNFLGNGRVNIYSTGLDDLFSWSGSTVIFQANLRDSAGSPYFIALADNDTSEQIYIYYDTSGGRWRYQLRLSSATDYVFLTDASPTGKDIVHAMTWSTDDDELKCYHDGTQIGSTTGLGVPTDSLISPTRANVGSRLTTSNFAKGNMRDLVVAGSTATASEIATVSGHIAAGTLTTTILDDAFGSDNYIWYKLDELYSSDGQGHAEGVAGGVGSGGADIEWHGPTWVNGAGGASNRPTLGDELLTNGDFSAWTGDDPDGWYVELEDASNYATEDANGMRFVSDASAVFSVQQTLSGVAVGDWIAVDLEVFNSDNGYQFRLLELSGSLGGYITYNDSTSGTGRVTESGAKFWILRRSSVSSAVVFSNASTKIIPTADLFRSIADLASPYAYASADWIITESTQAGLVLCLDDADDPQNFIIVYHGGASSIYIEKCVDGVYTTLGTISATYSAEATLTARTLPDGDDLSLWVWYGDPEVYIGNYTITDAGIVDNELHGLFSTHEDNEATNVVIYEATGHSIPGA